MNDKRLVRGGALLALLCACALLPAFGGGDRGRVTEVRPGTTNNPGVSVLIQIPEGLKVQPGQSVEVLRAGKTVGYGAVDQVFSRVAVATIGTLVAKEPLKDDEVRFLDGYHKDPKGRSAALPRGTVVSVRDGLVLLDFGKKQGLKLGHEVLLRDAESRKELGRITVELLGDTSGGGVISSGKAKQGAEAVAIGLAKPNKDGIDFVQLNLLGAVAELEDPHTYRDPSSHLGVPVRRILPKSPALRAGIKRGDRILAVDRTVVRDIASVRERIQARKNDQVKVLLVRGDRVLELAVDFPKK